MMKKIISILYLLVFITIVFMSCNPDPSGTTDDPTQAPTAGPTPVVIITTPTITTDPDIPEFFVTSTVVLSASGSEAGVTYHWSVTGGGNLSQTTGDSVTYTCPSMTGIITIGCTAIDGDGNESEEGTIDVTVFSMGESVLWLDAMDAGSFELPASGLQLTDGIGIKNWFDKSGNNNTATVDGAFPLYKVNQVSSSRPALQFRFEDEDRYPSFDIAADPSFNNITDISFFIIAKQRDVTYTSSHTLLQMDSGLAVAANTDNTIFSFTVNGTSSVSFANTLISEYAVIAGLYNSTTGRQAVWVDGILIDSTTYDQPVSCSGNLHIGGIGQDNTLHGYIGEVILFDKAITDAQIEYMSAYLSGKWGMNVVK